jgi:CBS domain-containing protein
MTVKDFLTPDVKSCRADTDLGAVATIMWDSDCGVVPVVNDECNVIGMITDRDICIAAATRSTSPSNLRVKDVMSGDVYSCSPEDDVRTALKVMRERRIRRLPVVDRDERLVGIISMNDLVAGAECRKGADVPGEEFLDTLKVICGRSTATIST